MFRRLKPGVEPETIRGRYRAVRRLCKAAEHDPAEIFAVDSHGDGAPELGGTKPFLFEIRQGRCGRLVEPEFLTVQAGSRIVRHSGILLPEMAELLRVHAVD